MEVSMYRAYRPAMIEPEYASLMTKRHYMRNRLLYSWTNFAIQRSVKDLEAEYQLAKSTEPRFFEQVLYFLQVDHVNPRRVVLYQFELQYQIFQLI